MLPTMVFFFISIQLLMVAYIDFKHGKIANLWLLINFIFFIILTLIYPHSYVWSWAIVFFPLAFIFVGFILFILNIMGGGDSKYLSSLFLLIPLGLQEVVLLYLLYTTVIVGSSLLLFNALKNFDIIIFYGRMGDVTGIKKIFGKKFTFAPVIFIAWVWFGWKNISAIKW